MSPASDNPRFVFAPAVANFGRMVTLSDVRDRVRQDLSDTASQRWPDDQLERHIAHALGELSLAIPREQAATIATTAGSRDIAIGEFEGMLEVEAVEYPVGEFPPAYAGFSVWGSTLALHLDTAPDGSGARVHYTAAHTLDEEDSTLPEHLVDILVTGASAYAAVELASATTGTLNLDPEASEHYAAWARARLTAFRQLLHTYGRKNRVRSRRLYVPA